MKIWIIFIFFLFWASGISQINEKSSSDWPMFMHDPQHTGFSPSTINQIQLLWVFDSKSQTYNLRTLFGNFPKIYSSPIVKKGSVYFIGDETIFSIDAKTGIKKWKKDVSSLNSGIAALDDYLFLLTNKGMVVLNSKEGNEIWEFGVRGKYSKDIRGQLHEHIISYPSAFGNLVVFGTGNPFIMYGDPPPAISEYNFLIALDIKEKKEIWKFETLFTYPYSPLMTTQKLIIGDGSIVCFNLESGDILWKNDDLSISTTSSLSSSSNRIFFISFREKVVSLDIETGNLIWSKDIGEWVNTTPALAYNKVFVISGDGILHALDMISGQEIWKTRVWYGHLKTNESYFAPSPVIADHKLFVGSKDGTIYCFNTETGQKIWEYETESEILSAPAIADGKLFVLTIDGKLYAFGEKEAETRIIRGYSREIMTLLLVLLLVSLLAISIKLLSRFSKK